MYLNKDDAKSTLAAGISSGATALSVISGQGSRFGNSTTQSFIGRLWGSAYSQPAQDLTCETVIGTWTSGDGFTIARGQNGSTAKAWLAGDNFALCFSALKMNEIESFLLFGQCRVSLQNSTTLLLSRLNGKALTIAGMAQVIPSGGVTLSSTGLSANTNYYVYAYMSAPTTMAMEAVTTAPSIDVNSGMRIKTGDASRTCVALVRVLAGPIFQDDTNARLVLSYFNRIDKPIKRQLTGVCSTASTTQVEMAANLECPFLTWGDEAVDLWTIGSGYASTALGYLTIGVDSTTSGEVPVITIPLTASVWSNGGVRQRKPAGVLAEGYHYSTVIGNVDTGGSLFLKYSSSADAFANCASVRG